MQKIFIILLISFNSIYGQQKDDIFRISGSTKNSWFLYLNRKRLIKLINKKEKSQKAWNKINY